MDENIKLIIACEAFKDELNYFKEQITVEIIWIEHSLHDNPDKLNRQIKDKIRSAEKTLAPGNTVLLFFGNCGGALDNIQSDTLHLIYPDVHDCIPVLIGSIERYRQMHAARPGVFYLNKAWIDSGAGPLGCLRKYSEIYGPEKGWRATQKLYKGYTHFMLIDNCCCELQSYREHVQEACQLFGKEYIEEKGSMDFVSAILNNTCHLRKISARQVAVISQEGD